MGQKVKMGSWVQLRLRLPLTMALAAMAAVGGLLLTTSTSLASPPHVTASVAAVDAACSTYLAQGTTSVSPSNLATIVDAYPTTASNLEAWLRNFDPMADPSAIQVLSPSAVVSACVLQGNWVLPSGGGTGTSNEGYEVVMIAPDGTSTPVLWGPSAIVTAAAPAVGGV
jgi:hypothetical protein